MGDDKKTGKFLSSSATCSSPKFVCEARIPLRPGSRARLRALEALGILDALWWSLMHF